MQVAAQAKLGVAALISDPFSKSYRRVFAATLEFEDFKKFASKHIGQIVDDNKRLKVLTDFIGYHIRDSDEDTLQLTINKRPLRRRDPQEKWAVENGPTLLYSKGAAGDIVVIVYPASSSVATAREDHLFLRIGQFSAHELKNFLKKDISDFAAYSHATIIDGDTTWGEWLRVLWLRFTRAKQVDGKYQGPSINSHVVYGLEILARATIMSALKPAMILLVAALLLYFGASHLIQFISR